MNSDAWFLYSVAAMLAGAGYIVLGRKLTKLEVPIFAVLTWAMLATAIGAAFMANSWNVPLILPNNGKTTTVLILAALCCFAGNAGELAAIVRAPNAAYVSAINKSYAAVTIFAAWWLFGSEVTWLKVAGSMVVVASMILVRAPWEQKKSDIADSGWIAYSLISFAGLAGLSLCSKYLMQGGMDRLIFLVLLASPVSAMFAAGWAVSGKKGKWDFQKIALMAGIGVVAVSLNYFLYSAILMAPNLGYVNAINSAQVIVIAGASALLGDKLTFWRTLGIGGASFGLLLIAI